MYTENLQCKKFEFYSNRGQNNKPQREREREYTKLFLCIVLGLNLKMSRIRL